MNTKVAVSFVCGIAILAGAYLYFQEKEVKVPEPQAVQKEVTKVEPPLNITPTKVGECGITTVVSVGTRLGDSDTVIGTHEKGSGSSIRYANNLSQVSYEDLEGIYTSRGGDKVKLCLVSIPENCPAGDDRGKVYSATNLRTNDSWEAADSQHMCGGV